MNKFKRTFIIAEAGVNHNGSIKIAKNLIDVAVNAGADAVKFQTFKANSIVSKYAPKAVYQKRTTPISESHFEMIKKLELDFDDHKELVRYCNQKGIVFISSPFDLESIDLLNGLGLKIFKIPSGEITNLPYLRKIGSLGKQIIMSTGMASLDEVKDAMEVLLASGTKRENITVLHCTTEYPAPIEEVNLKAMLTIKEKLKVNVGYSDHTMGIDIPIAATVLGARVIEKHFTLSKKMEGPDHKASLEPQELEAMVKAIRYIEKAMGTGIKKPSKSEIKNIAAARKSIVAARDIKKGKVFTEDDLAVKRPGTGISPMQWDMVIGKKAKRNFKKDELIEL